MFAESKLVAKCISYAIAKSLDDGNASIYLPHVQKENASAVKPTTEQLKASYPSWSYELSDKCIRYLIEW